MADLRTTTRTIPAAEAVRKERLPELEMLRGLAILGVLTVHATSSAVVEVQNSWVREAYVALNAFSLFCVPAFIFLTGFVLFYNYFDRPMTRSGLGAFYGKRLKQLVVPYISVSLGYELAVSALKHRSWEPADILGRFGKHLLNGGAYPHLYYVIITIQLYVLFPLLLLLFRKLRLPAAWAVPLGFGAQWAFYLLHLNVWHLEAKGSWSFTYFAAFLLGAYGGMRPDALKSWLGVGDQGRGRGGKLRFGLIAALWLAVSAGFLRMHVAYRSGGTVPEGYWFEIGYNLFTLLTTLVLLGACFRIVKGRMAGKPSAVLADLGALSFGVYLVHPFFLLLYHRHPPASATPLVYHLWTAGGFVFALGASLLVLLPAHRYIRGAWLVLGPAPPKFGPKPNAEAAQEGTAAPEVRLKEATE
ncbi:acyltransferase [Paenibacillus sp. MWE-103]|uniref:Acyltransferase n=1 Tax=Paenibacillus artemisiicola TaxID=1172618 RepID=A0ABS3W8W3_9BACL|nr:acyltransferase [Paenibacillus artemisiicola]